MRVAILGPYFWPQTYGIEKVMYAHAKHLAARGHDVLVISSRLCFPDGARKDLPGRESRDNFVIRRLHIVLRAPPLPKFNNYTSNGGFVLRGLRKTLAAFRPDVVHAHNIGAPAWALGGALHGQRFGSAFFYSPHYHPGRLRFDFARKLLIRAMNYIPLHTASKIYHLTSRDFALFPIDYSYAPADRFAVLLNGVDPAVAEPRPRPEAAPINVLFVGRVDDARKGFAILEAAIDALSHDIRERFVLTVVGEIGEESRLRISTKYGNAVRVTGLVSEAALEHAYAVADVFVMPSLYEGFGMPFIEAMRYRVPVVGTTVGGIPEVVPSDTGILVPPGDVRAVSSAIATLIANPAVRAAMGAAGEAWSKRFHWSTIVDGLEADYRAAIDHALARR